MPKRPRRLTPLQRRAKRRAAIARIRKNAPRHPKAQEARMRLAMADLFGDYHDNIKATVLHFAPFYLEHKRRPRTFAFRESWLASVFRDLYEYGRHLLASSPFKRIVEENANKTADSARAQVAKALQLDDFDPDLTEQIDELTDGLYDAADSRLNGSVQRAQDVLEQWADGEADLEDLPGRLDDGLDGILGGALASVALNFGWGFGEMNKAAQDEADVASYMWVAQKDSAVRPEHLALDGEQFGWDEVALSAEDSSSGEDCQPGEDFNCRCIASPIPPEGLPN